MRRQPFCLACARLLHSFYSNGQLDAIMRWIIPEPLVPRQEDRRLGERDCNLSS